MDPERLRLVLEAFIEALAWWTNEGPVRIEGAVRNGRLVLEARRRGTMLSQEDAERLFLARAPGTGSGSKIGLFVANGVASAQGGTTSVRVGDELMFGLDVPAEPANRSV